MRLFRDETGSHYLANIPDLVFLYIVFFGNYFRTYFRKEYAPTYQGNYIFQRTILRKLLFSLFFVAGSDFPELTGPEAARHTINVWETFFEDIASGNLLILARPERALKLSSNFPRFESNKFL